MRSEMVAANDRWLVSCLNAMLDPNLGARRSYGGIKKDRIWHCSRQNHTEQRFLAGSASANVKKHYFTVFPQDKDSVFSIIVSTGYKTRSKSKLQPDQFTRVSALQKIFSLLARGLVEGQEAASG
ncbi:uncharacterized protein LOC112347645 [Selaginella moellendorffii]|uniref:uncharacterized protein LOC112347645 n=1 Tax=Selaginella moellendorffii TaxID=88036 RepID=UPI000D1D1151|nr:uncharacterized protein LOC112347645 [Selaginella moellendorffii]|eukprot:XP_024534629.1 uncharacterized protein LOC112347645 [Selaginella moellendorffii]